MTTYLETRRFDGSLSNDLHTDDLTLIPEGYVRISTDDHRFFVLIQRASHEAVAPFAYESEGGNEIVAIWISMLDLDVLWGNSIGNLVSSFEETANEEGQRCSDIVYRRHGVAQWRFRTVRNESGMPVSRTLDRGSGGFWHEEMRLDGSRESAVEIVNEIRHQARPQANYR